MNVTGKLSNPARPARTSSLGSKIRGALSFGPKLPKRTRWIIGSLLLIAIAGGFAYYKLVYLPSLTSSTPTMQTSMVRQGNLVISASGTGTLVSKDEVDLAFEATGKVTEVNVKVGDQVKAGDLLAKVDETDLRLQYTQAKRALDELTSASAIADAQAGVATAQADLGSAIQHLAYVISPTVLHWENRVDEAKQQLANAQAKAAASPSDKDTQAAVQKAEAALTYARTNLTGAQYSYEETYLKNNFTITTIDQKTHEKVTYLAEPTAADILSARASVAEAQASLTEAQNLYAALTGDDIADNATGSGLTSLEQAKSDVETAKSDLDGASLYATISGTVMAVNISAGDSVNSGTTAITISDLSQPYLEVFLDESDWSNVKTGADADVTFDILPDQTFTGTVTQVDPGLYTQGNSSVVRAYVKLADSDAASLNLPLGTSASVEVIGSKAENAILVPVEALHKTDSGDYTVFVLENGTPKLRSVTIGIQDLIDAAVTSGLQVGDVVTTGVTVAK
jgi:HlyD family secretion protein